MIRTTTTKAVKRQNRCIGKLNSKASCLRDQSTAWPSGKTETSPFSASQNQSDATLSFHYLYIRHWLFIYNSTCGSLAKTKGMKWKLKVIFVNGLNCFSRNQLSSAHVLQRQDSAHVLQRQDNKSWSSETTKKKRAVKILTVFCMSFK